MSAMRIRNEEDRKKREVRLLPPAPDPGNDTIVDQRAVADESAYLDLVAADSVCAEAARVAQSAEAERVRQAELNRIKRNADVRPSPPSPSSRANEIAAAPSLHQRRARTDRSGEAAEDPRPRMGPRENEDGRTALPFRVIRPARRAGRAGDSERRRRVGYGAG